MEVLRGLPKTVLDDLQVHHIGGEDCPNGGPSASAMAANLTLPWHHVGANISDEVLNPSPVVCRGTPVPLGC